MRDEQALRVLLGIIIISAFVFFVEQSRGQEIDRAPTLEQCKADVRAWFEQAHSANNDSEQIGANLESFTVPQLLNRKIYLNDCWSIDRGDSQRILGLGDLYGAEIIGRYRNFLKRRGLLKDFLLEDADGKR